MHRSHTCGALRQSDVNKDVQLAGWVQRIRDKGFVLWIDLRDRYGLTQLVLDEERCDAALLRDGAAARAAAGALHPRSDGDA